MPSLLHSPRRRVTPPGTISAFSISCEWSASCTWSCWRRRYLRLGTDDSIMFSDLRRVSVRANEASVFRTPQSTVHTKKKEEQNDDSNPHRSRKAIPGEHHKSNDCQSLVAEDATYVSLNYDNPDLKKIMPWAGTGKGPQAFIDTFTRVSQFWQILAFSPEELFGAGENVAVFGPIHLQIEDAGKNRRISVLDSFPRAMMARSFTSNSWRTLRDGASFKSAEVRYFIAIRMERRSRSDRIGSVRSVRRMEAKRDTPVSHQAAPARRSRKVVNCETT